MRKRHSVKTICERQHRSLRMWALSVFALVILVLTNTCDAHADTQTWNVTAACDATLELGYGCSVPAVISATMTTEQTLGNWACPMCLGPLTNQVEPNITAISGTFDGMAMTLIGTGGWMYENNPQQGFPEEIAFSAGGSDWLIYYDVFFTLENTQTGLFEQMDWSAPDPIITPESPTLPLVLAGVVLALWAYRRQRARSQAA